MAMFEYVPINKDKAVVYAILDELEAFSRKQPRLTGITQYIADADDRVRKAAQAAESKSFPNNSTLASARRAKECEDVDETILKILVNCHKNKLELRGASMGTAYNRVIGMLSQVSNIRDLYTLPDVYLTAQVGKLAREGLQEAIDTLKALNQQFTWIHRDPHTDDLTEYGRQIVDLVDSIPTADRKVGERFEKAWGEHFSRAQFAQCALNEVLHILELIKKETDRAAGGEPQEGQSNLMDLS
jgi:hypothetical protein